jgi:hypothetical protein
MVGEEVQLCRKIIMVGEEVQLCRKIIMVGEEVQIQKIVVAYLKLLSQHSLGECKEDSWSGQSSTPLKFELGISRIKEQRTTIFRVHVVTEHTHIIRMVISVL